MVKEDYIPLKNKISSGPRKGDLVVTHGYHWKSRLIRYFTNYYENHVGIITQDGKNPKFMHSDGNGTYEEDFYNYIQNYDGFVGYKPLTKVARLKFKKKIKIFEGMIEYKRKKPGFFDLKKVILVGIFHKPVEEVIKIKGKNDLKNKETLFCSQFVTMVYQKVGIFPRRIISNLLSPGAAVKGFYVFGTTEKETIWLNKLKRKK